MTIRKLIIFDRLKDMMAPVTNFKFKERVDIVIDNSKIRYHDLENMETRQKVIESFHRKDNTKNVNFVKKIY